MEARRKPFKGKIEEDKSAVKTEKWPGREETNKA
jgi:hypothetical protein